MKGCWMAESLDDDRGESYNDTSCVAPSKYAVPRISLPQPHNHESDSHSQEPQSHVDQRKYRHLAASTPLLGTPREHNYCSVLLGIPPNTASTLGLSGISNEVGPMQELFFGVLASSGHTRCVSAEEHRSLAFVCSPVTRGSVSLHRCGAAHQASLRSLRIMMTSANSLFRKGRRVA